MHLQTHVLSGWCAANCLPLAPRERLLAMAAASVADLDGLSILGGLECYATYHHVVAHTLWVSLAVAAGCAALSRNRLTMLLLGAGLFHLHLYLDYLGSGPGWDIYYLWPVHWFRFRNPHPWEFSSWQNLTACYILFAWAVWIAFHHKRSPFELVLPAWDRIIVRWVTPRRDQNPKDSNPKSQG